MDDERHDTQTTPPRPSREPSARDVSDVPEDEETREADETAPDDTAPDESAPDDTAPETPPSVSVEEPTDDAVAEAATGATEASEHAEAEAATTPPDVSEDADEAGAQLAADEASERGGAGDPQQVISGSEDPEAAARAALGLGERDEEDGLEPSEAEAILRAAGERGEGVGTVPVEEEAEEAEEAVETAPEAVEAELGDADLVEVFEEEPAEPSPYDRPGDWFVVHTYSGYEKKVKSNLESRARSLNLEGRIHEVVIPMDDVIEFKGGKKTVVQKKVFPGYLLVRMHLDDNSWQAVRNTPGVTGFVGGSAKPTPLSRKEVESILRVRPEDEAKKARPRLEFEVGDQVRVAAGPFADFNGMIDEINVDQSTLKVLVNIFGRETPVTLDFADVAKL